MAEGGVVGRVFGQEEAEDAEDRDISVTAADPLTTAALLDNARADPELSRRLGDYGRDGLSIARRI